MLALSIIKMYYNPSCVITCSKAHLLDAGANVNAGDGHRASAYIDFGWNTNIYNVD